MRLRSANKKPTLTPPKTTKRSRKYKKSESSKSKKGVGDIINSNDRPKNHIPSSKENSTFIEKGHISFFYRPKVEVEKAHSPDDVQRFFVLLEPIANAETESPTSRLLIIAKKHMPDMNKHEKVYAFVWKIGKSKKLLEYLDSEEYDTSTRGHRVLEQARPCGHGVYGIVTKENRTYLAYVLEFPVLPAQVQISLNIKKEGSYLLIIKV